MNCSYVNEFKYLYYIQSNPLDDNFINKVDLLPFKCIKEIKDITKNIEFWLYIMFIVLIIISNILYYLFYNKKYKIKQL